MKSLTYTQFVKKDPAYTPHCQSCFSLLLVTFTMDPNLIFIIAGFAALITSLSVGVPFDFTLLGINLIIGGGLGAIFEPDGFFVATATTGILSALYVIFARQLFIQWFGVTTKNSNTDALLHQSVVVVKTITPDQPGQIKFQGELWRAQATSEIQANSHAIITKVEGVTVTVEAEE